MYLIAKRIIDLIASCMALVIFSPLFLIIIFAIRIETKSSVVFKQNRVGKNKKLFRMYKFRTMSIDAPKYVPTGKLIEAGSHITKIGKFLRKTSLDELPQIINIIKGDMAIVGPRPVIKADSELIDARDKYGANGVLPGLTGWAQVNGRDTISAEKKAQLDGYYVEHMSFSFDAMCIFKTIVSVLQKKDIVEGDEAYYEYNEDDKI